MEKKKYSWFLLMIFSYNLIPTYYPFEFTYFLYNKKIKSLDKISK